MVWYGMVWYGMVWFGMVMLKYGLVASHQMAKSAIKLDQPSVNICQDTKTISVWRHLSCNLFTVISPQIENDRDCFICSISSFSSENGKLFKWVHLTSDYDCIENWNKICTKKIFHVFSSIFIKKLTGERGVYRILAISWWWLGCTKNSKSCQISVLTWYILYLYVCRPKMQKKLFFRHFLY